MLEAWLGGDPGQVLILTPLVVLDNVQFLTTIPLTSSSSLYLPRLPILLQARNWRKKKPKEHSEFSEINSTMVIYNCYLMPCPGPQKTLEMEMLVAPCPMEMQSSPVPMLLLVILTKLELLIWMPSVFGLFAGAVIFRSWTVILALRVMNMWNDFAFTELIPLTTELFTLWNLIDCTKSGKVTRRISY